MSSMPTTSDKIALPLRVSAAYKIPASALFYIDTKLYARPPTDKSEI